MPPIFIFNHMGFEPMRLKNALLIICLTLIAILHTGVSHAQQQVTLIIDAELNDYLKSLAAPLLKAAELNPDYVQVHLVQDNTINAFVTSQQDIYVNTGLILKAETENEVVGVLAHEIGHMKGHHILRIINASEQVTIPTILAGLAGIGIAAAGAPDAGVAVLAGSQAAGISSLLQFSRSQEQQADQIGVNLLEATETSSQGLKDFFNRLRTNELMYYKTPPAYLMTHPRSSDRESFLDRVQSQPHQVSDKEADRFARIQAKVAALTASSGQVRRLYMEQDSGPADYVRSIAFAMQGKYDDALQALDKAETKLSADAQPYVEELRGQIALDRGHTEQARDHFEKALSMAPESMLLRFHYARALTHTGDYEGSITQFNRVIRQRPTWWLPHYNQGLAYGKAGEKGLSHLAFAESNLYRRNAKDGLFHVGIAQQYLAEETEKKGTDNTFNLQKAAQVKLELEKLRN